jgi:hypothetical protein
MSSLEEKIKDKRFTNLIKSILNAGHFNHYGLFMNGDSSFNNLKSIIYPILIDIYLEGLDSYFSHLSSQKDKKLSYLRSGSELILGISGSYSDCLDIVAMLVNYFKLKLLIEIPKEAFIVVNLTKQKSYVVFLGFRISM